MSAVAVVFKRLGLDGRFARNVAALAGGTALGQGAILLTAPILTRFYTPGDVGLLGLLASFVGAASIAAGLRYEAALVGADDDGEAARLLAAATGLAVPCSALAAGGLSLAMSGDWLGFGGLPGWTPWLAGPLTFATFLYGAMRLWLVRMHDFPRAAKAAAAQGVARAILPLCLAGTAPGFVGLASGEAAGRLFGLGASLRQAAAWMAGLRTQLGLAQVRTTLGKYWKYPAVFLPSSLVDTLATLVPLPIVNHLYGLEAAGLFALAQRLVAGPVGLVASSVADVFHREAATRREQGGDLAALVAATSRRLLRAGALPAVAVAALAPFVSGPLFGARWETVGWLLTILAPQALATVTVNPVTRVVLVAHRPEAKLIYDVVAFAAAVGGLFGAHAAGLDFLAAMAVGSGLQCLAFGLYYALLMRVARGA